MSRSDNLYAERRRLQSQIAEARRNIAALEDDPTVGQQKSINIWQQDIENLQSGISSIDADIADLQRRPVSDYDDRSDPRDRTVFDRYGDGPQRIDHRSRY